MATTEALLTIGQDWARVGSRLTDAQINAVVQHVSGGQNWDETVRDSAHNVVSLERSLRADIPVSTIEEQVLGTLFGSFGEGEPMWSALHESLTRLEVGSSDRARNAVVSLAELAATELLRRDEESQSHADGVEDAVRRDVLRFGYVEVDDDRMPSAVGYPVIVVELNDRRVAPTFQFQADAAARQIIAYANEALEAGNDPLGAACWWLSQNAWLDAVPAALLNTSRAEEIRLAVDQLSSDSW